MIRWAADGVALIGVLMALGSLWSGQTFFLFFGLIFFVIGGLTLIYSA
jgi:hypothetical protein